MTQKSGELVSFRIKPFLNKRAVSFSRILADIKPYGGPNDNQVKAVVGQKGIRLMIRQFLKSLYKEAYATEFEFRYYIRGDKLVVLFPALPTELYNRVSEDLKSVFGREVADQYSNIDDEKRADGKTIEVVELDLNEIEIHNSTDVKTGITPKGKIKKNRPDNPPEPAPAPKNNSASKTEPSSDSKKLIKATIISNEGPTLTKKVFDTWAELQLALKFIGVPDGGYNKVNLYLQWENGKYAKLRVYLASRDGYLNPENETIGDYLKDSKPTIFEVSNFTDDQPLYEQADWSDDIKQTNSDKSNSDKSNVYIYGENDMIAFYGPDWRDGTKVGEYGWTEEMDELLGQPLTKLQVETIRKQGSVDVAIRNGDLFVVGIEATVIAIENMIDFSSIEELKEIQKAIHHVAIADGSVTSDCGRLSIQIDEYVDFMERRAH